MPAKAIKTFEAKTVAEWKKWLAKHHATEPEVWLIFYKKHAGAKGVAHKDALDEALCYGWIDSLVRRIDDDRFAIKFTPRKPDSKWSSINKKRYLELKAEGRLTPAGVNRPPTEETRDAPERREFGFPRYIRVALENNPTAQRNFDALPPSHRRRYIGWIDTAKKEETKQRRLEEAIRLLSKGKKLGLK
jgi:uncharacterized protein YdeI (YjbR/CyaY-like superfamily)